MSKSIECQLVADDPRLRQMQAVQLACIECGVPIPEEVTLYLRATEHRQHSAQEIINGDCFLYDVTSLDGRRGYEITLHKLPPDITRLRLFRPPMNDISEATLTEEGLQRVAQAVRARIGARFDPAILRLIADCLLAELR